MDTQTVLALVAQPETEGAQIDGWLRALLPYLDLFPDIELSTEEKTALVPLLFSESSLLVRRVAGALARERDLFPDIPLDPAGMIERLQRSHGWLALRDLCLLLAERAEACHRIEHGTAVSQALQAVQQVRADSHRPFQGDREALRAAVMLLAEGALTDWQAHKRRGS